MMIVKVCPTCGKRFDADDDELAYCSLGCYKNRDRNRKCGRQEYDKLAYEKRVEERKRLDAAERRRRNLAARDAAYAANAPKVTVEEHVKRGGRVVVIETRGNRCIGGWGV